MGGSAQQSLLSWWSPPLVTIPLCRHSWELQSLLSPGSCPNPLRCCMGLVSWACVWWTPIPRFGMGSPNLPKTCHSCHKIGRSSCHGRQLPNWGPYRMHFSCPTLSCSRLNIWLGSVFHAGMHGDCCVVGCNTLRLHTHQTILLHAVCAVGSKGGAFVRCTRGVRPSSRRYTASLYRPVS